MASVVAFALGAISELPSIQWFSVYAAFSTFCILAAMVRGCAVQRAANDS